VDILATSTVRWWSCTYISDRCSAVRLLPGIQPVSANCMSALSSSTCLSKTIRESIMKVLKTWDMSYASAPPVGHCQKAGVSLSTRPDASPGPYRRISFWQTNDLGLKPAKSSRYGSWSLQTQILHSETFRGQMMLWILQVVSGGDSAMAPPMDLQSCPSIPLRLWDVRCGGGVGLDCSNPISQHGPLLGPKESRDSLAWNWASEEEDTPG
ncbi:uncharacterized protein B0T23DRAFT_150198, partial [Neurospora hispaniola]